MKRNHLSVFAILAAVGALSLANCNRAAGEEEQKVVTEVAVQVAKVVRTTLRAHVEAYGQVEPEPAGGGKSAGAARLSAPAAGMVMSVPAKEGEGVEAGAVIVKLDDRVALAQLRLAEQQMERQNKLKETGGTSEKLVQEAAQQLAAAQAQLALVQLTSPIAGVVARINVQPGQAVDGNTVVAEIVDSSRLVVTANVPADEAALLKTGQPAELFSGSSKTPVATGAVSFVSPLVDAKTATVLVRVSVPPDARLRSGQFVRVSIITEERAGKLAVPREAVYKDYDGQSTLSIVEGDMAKQKIVRTGLRDGNLVEVEGDGVTEGATVVTLGSYALPKETKIRILNAAKEEAK
jgi:membrane fusion protein (multidrug efflux system)